MFSQENHAILQKATHHLSWLLTRGYAPDAAAKLVGDRFELRQRQRLAVRRSACSDQALQVASSKQIDLSEVEDRALDIDTFNLVTTVEAALAGGVVLECRDGTFRDMASMHGSYRKVDQTIPALQIIGETLAQNRNSSNCKWWIDRPVSNSGRLAGFIRDAGEKNGWDWTTELINDPDPLLIQSENIVVSADSAIIADCQLWTNLARIVVERISSPVFLVPMVQ